MTSRRLAAAALAPLLLGVVAARADEVRYYQEGGVTYCETRRTVDQRVPQSRMEERSETVYREQLSTEIRDTTRTYWTPVTEYRWESYWVGRWNPLAEPYLAYRYVPQTHWEMRTETVQVPCLTRRLAPETRTTRRPVGGFRTVQKEVVNRVAVSQVPPGAPLVPSQAPTLAQRGQIGGISRLDDPVSPRGAGTAWRPSTGTVRR